MPRAKIPYVVDKDDILFIYKTGMNFCSGKEIWIIRLMFERDTGKQMPKLTNMCIYTHTYIYIHTV